MTVKDHLKEVVRREHKTVFKVEVEGKTYEIYDLTAHPDTNDVVFHAKAPRVFHENKTVPAQQ